MEPINSVTEGIKKSANRIAEQPLPNQQIIPQSEKQQNNVMPNPVQGNGGQFPVQNGNPPSMPGGGQQMGQNMMPTGQPQGQNYNPSGPIQGQHFNPSSQIQGQHYNQPIPTQGQNYNPPKISDYVPPILHSAAQIMKKPNLNEYVPTIPNNQQQYPQQMMQIPYQNSMRYPANGNNIPNQMPNNGYNIQSPNVPMTNTGTMNQFNTFTALNFNGKSQG